MIATKISVDRYARSQTSSPFPMGVVLTLFQTALHFCASKTNLEVARTLINHKATARVKDKRGHLPLHRAAAVGSVPMVQLLLDNRSPINATDMSGFTALHHGNVV